MPASVSAHLGIDGKGYKISREPRDEAKLGWRWNSVGGGHGKGYSVSTQLGIEKSKGHVMH